MNAENESAEPRAENQTMDDRIDKRNAEIIESLQGDAKDVAIAYLQAFPGAELVSGGRDIEEQARAVAGNCFQQRSFILGQGKPGDADYIKGVYKDSIAAQRLHKWSIGHPKASVAELTKAFVVLLQSLSKAQREAFSMHFARAAFDPKVTAGELGSRMKAWLHDQARARGGTFLEKEGNLLRWHWQAKKTT